MTTTFTPIASLAGGALIGLGAVMLMAFSGRIAGVSGIAARLLPPFVDRELAGRLAFLAGLVAVPSIFLLATGQFPAQSIETGGVLLAFAGLLVGFGAVWGNGCTSRHGVSGISLLSVRSLLAPAVFLAAGVSSTLFVPPPRLR